MKKIILVVTTLVVFGITGSAQKYAYVDSEYILENIPEYKDAQNELDDIAVEYQKEIEDKFAEIDKMYRDFQAEAVLLPDDIKKKKEEEIVAKEQEVQELQKKRFGKDGDLFQKREELVKPIQEKIYNAIEEIAEDKNYAFVFDKSGSLTILYVSVKFDISDDVLDMVGAELGTVRREDRKRTNQPPVNPGDNNLNKTEPERNGDFSPSPIRK
ncbi:MAG: OmpH family outer membrane protein [Bacteroidales bacterium]|nr:OmpH family outer membrane protein [Bacteroidales bacterium]